MELDARDILRVLRQKGVEKLHHANTVRTACSFLRQGKLLSRGTLDELGLPQTDQQTDEIPSHPPFEASKIKPSKAALSRLI